MAKFFQSENNGVIALIREDHAQLHGRITTARGNPFLAGVKVFTFCSAERLVRNPEQRRFFTGTYDFARMILSGHCTGDCSDQVGNDRWNGFVPFSNQDYENSDYLTTSQDVVEIFGLIRDRTA